MTVAKPSADDIAAVATRLGYHPAVPPEPSTEFAGYGRPTTRRFATSTCSSCPRHRRRHSPYPDLPPRGGVVQPGDGNVRQHRPFRRRPSPGPQPACGNSDGLPVGLMLVGRHFDEPTIYRAAHAYEQRDNWR